MNKSSIELKLDTGLSFSLRKEKCIIEVYKLNDLNSYNFLIKQYCKDKVNSYASFFAYNNIKDLFNEVNKEIIVQKELNYVYPDLIFSSDLLNFDSIKNEFPEDFL